MTHKTTSLHDLADRGWAVNFRCRACMHNTSWTAASLAELLGGEKSLEDLDGRLRCRRIRRQCLGLEEWWEPCLGSGFATVIAPAEALGPDGRTTLGEIYGVQYPKYSLEAVRSRRTAPVTREDWPNAAR